MTYLMVNTVNAMQGLFTTTAQAALADALAGTASAPTLPTHFFLAANQVLGQAPALDRDMARIGRVGSPDGKFVTPAVFAPVFNDRDERFGALFPWGPRPEADSDLLVSLNDMTASLPPDLVVVWPAQDGSAFSATLFSQASVVPPLYRPTSVTSAEKYFELLRPLLGPEELRTVCGRAVLRAIGPKWDRKPGSCVVIEPISGMHVITDATAGATEAATKRIWTIYPDRQLFVECAS